MCDLACFLLEETTEEEYSVKKLGHLLGRTLKNFYCKMLNIKLKKQMQIFLFLLTSLITSLPEDTCFIKNSEKCKGHVLRVLIGEFQFPSGPKNLI